MLDLLEAVAYILIYWRTWLSILVCSAASILILAAFPSASRDVLLGLGAAVVVIAFVRDLRAHWADKDDET